MGITILEPSRYYRKKPLFSKEEVISDFTVGFKSRLLSKHIRSEVLSGKAKFGIESAGKELCQIAMSKSFKKGDFFSGYYRDQTFMMHKGLADVKDVMYSLYGDAKNDSFSAGRNMNNHFATPFVDKNDEWLDHVSKYNVASAISPLAGQIPRALGLALASKYYKQTDQQNRLSNKGSEVSFAVLGDGTTSEGVFFESVNAACAMQVPIVFVIQDDGYGISVPSVSQTTKGSISEALAGFQRTEKGQLGCEIYEVKGWDYTKLNATFKTAVEKCREEYVPVIIHVTQLTQLNGHSTSGSHERYKPKARLQWEKEMDCLVHLEKYIIDNGMLCQEELEDIKIQIAVDTKVAFKEAWNTNQEPFKNIKSEFLELVSALEITYPESEAITKAYSELKLLTNGSSSNILEASDNLIMRLLTAEKSEALEKLKKWQDSHKKSIQDSYQSHLHCTNEKAAINVPVVRAEYDDEAPSVNGYEVLNAYFDQLLEANENVLAFGEDVGLIGGVNQGFVGLQKKYGEHRVSDTGIREWTIVGQGIGLAMRGLRPIAEIQYLDYLVYAMPALTDELSTLRWRTAGQQIAPAIIRTRGHRLEGIWHSGSPMSMLLGSIKGVYLLTPRNMTQAAGMYNTLMQGNDPAVLIECLNGYRKKEKMPSNLDTFTVPLGVPDILNKGNDITIVTYGACVSVAQEAVSVLESIHISAELIDVQTLMPFDLEHTISHSVKKTNRVIFLDEDVPSGGTAYMMREVLEKQGAYSYLDSIPVCISASEHRPPYGDDGNYSSKPLALDIVKAAMELMNESAPNTHANYMPA